MLASLRLNLSRRLRRPGHLFLGNARVKPRKQSSRRVADLLHVHRSFRGASAFHEQMTTQERQDAVRVRQGFGYV